MSDLEKFIEARDRFVAAIGTELTRLAGWVERHERVLIVQASLMSTCGAIAGYPMEAAIIWLYVPLTMIVAYLKRGR